MKLWQLLLIQLVLISIFLYAIFGSNQDRISEKFMQNSVDYKMESKPIPQPPEPQEPTNVTNTTNTTESSPEDEYKPPPLPKKNRTSGFQGGSAVAMPSVNSTSIKGKSKDVKVIYKSKRSATDSCSQINQRPVKLCKMGLVDNCKRYHVSEELSSWWMLSPIYTASNNQTEHLYDLHRNFRNYIKSYGINFQTVEVIFPGQEFQLTEPDNQPYDLQYQAEWIFAMRENLVNVGIKHLPGDWEYMSWIDQHIFWLDPYWFEKSILAFSHNNIVHLLNGNDFWNLKNTTDYYLEGFARLYLQIGNQFERHDPRQCGLAWGMRSEIFEKLGGLLDICIGTKCDLYQNYAYVGRRYTAQTNNKEYANMIGQWQDHAIWVYDKKIGYVDSKVAHFMHCYGDCKTSEYNQQVWALMRNGYNPRLHIKRDFEGRMSLVNNKPLALALWGIYGGPPRE